MMTTIGDMQDSSKQEMIALYGTSFHYPDGEFRKSHESMEMNSHCCYGNHHNSNLARYRSAPSAFFDSHMISCSNGVGDSGSGGSDKDYRFCRSSSPEMDTVLDRFLSPNTCSGGSSSRDIHLFEANKSSAAVKQEGSDPDFAFPSSFRFHDLSYMNGGSSIERSFGIVGSDGTLNPLPLPSGSSATVSSSVPSRQNSSPALFSDLGVNNGFSLVWDSGSSKPSSSPGGESSPQKNRMSNHINFSLGSMYAPQISPTTEEKFAVRDREDAGEDSKRSYSSAFQNLSWDDISGTSLRKSRDDEHRSFSLLGSPDNLNENSGNRVSGLTHHLSLPKTFSEMATMEKLYQLQGAVPCKIRAKRGFATHPRSIAERQRRTRISERMRKLQNLFPNMDKQTSTADMLELAVEHIKELQDQVKTLKDTKARCTC